MFKVVKKSIEWGGRTLTIETGKIARQADGAVLVSYGQTSVLCTAVAKKEAKEGMGFFPLTVNYQEKAYAAGKIPGGFFKREGRPSEKETLVSRLIDRPIRPLFPEGFYNEVQVICTVVSHDLENDPDVVAMVGASAALALSGVPFDGPIAASRVGYVNGEYVLNPVPAQLEESQLDLVVAGTESSVLMVESEAKILTEEVMLGSVEFGHREMQPVIALIKELKAEAGKEEWTLELPDHSELTKKIFALAEKDLRAAYNETDKQARVEKIGAAKNSVKEALLEQLCEDDFDGDVISSVLKKVEQDIVRGDIIKNRTRIDGRSESDVRAIVTEASILDKTHGSALFTRGETQALAVVTLGTGQDQQVIDALEGEYKQPFMLHYNFPPYSVGEVGRLAGAGRREIGHGKLAWRALNAVIPSEEEFGYTVRVVSEVTESNGSSSMATVCGSSLAMMDAGVPLKSAVAGIAMGLIKEGDEFVVLSDILGDEDHLGDMDFKVAGTQEGITALQMDIKINGITTEIMKVALEQAKGGRQHILGKMAETLTAHRDDVNQNAPRIVTIQIDKEKIGALIGPGGKNIRDICERTGAKIDISDDGTVSVATVDGKAAEEALAIIQESTAEAEIGKIYSGKVTKLLDFGALVNFLGKLEGLVHISEMKKERIEAVTDAVNEGDEVKVKVLSIDRGKVRLSMKRVDQESGEDLSDQFDDDGSAPRSSRRDRDNRGGNRRDRDNRGGGNRKKDNREKGEEPANNEGNSDNSDDEGGRKKRFF